MICRYSSASGVPPPTTPEIVCGSLKLNSPASGSGFTATTLPPLSLHSFSAESIRGWLVPGFCPTTKMSSESWMSSRETVPLPMPMVGFSADPDDSWHMFEQSGRLLVPRARANNWYINAVSFAVRPEV
ncbi:hypothetical protein D9M72_608500 [compost metagenome]